MMPDISDHESSPPSSPSTNDSLTNDLDNCDDQENKNENDDDDESSSNSTRSLIRPNTRSANKRTSSHSHTTSDQPSVKRRC